MANADTPNGMRPVRYRNGTAWNGQANLYRVSATTSLRVGLYSPVVSTGGFDSEGLRVVKKHDCPTTANGTVAILGVAVGFQQSTPGHKAASLDGSSQAEVYYIEDDTHYALVVDDPDVIFEIQEDGLTPVNNYGLMAGLTDASANTTTGLASHEVDSSTILSATSTQVSVVNSVLVLGASYRVDGSNVAGTTNATLDVIISNHEFRPMPDVGVVGV